jgi:hypothetical protein
MEERWEGDECTKWMKGRSDKVKKEGKLISPRD